MAYNRMLTQSLAVLYRCVQTWLPPWQPVVGVGSQAGGLGHEVLPAGLAWTAIVQVCGLVTCALLLCWCLHVYRQAHKESLPINV